jgi:hypothetical protein
MSDQHLELVPVTAASAPTTAERPAPEAPTAAPEARPDPGALAAATPRPQRARSRRTAEPGASRSKPAAGEGAWREWERPGQTFSYRLPPELIDELEERLWQLRIREVGVTVAAAITHLLDLGDDELRELVDRADAAKPRRRAAGRAPHA